MNEEQNRAEREYIEMEAARIDSAERYFDARPQFDTVDRRKVFESGFDRGWKAAIASLPKSVPEGYVLVPIEPTGEMLDAAIKNNSNVSVGRGTAKVFIPVYKAMIAAAPQPTDERVRSLLMRVVEKVRELEHYSRLFGPIGTRTLTQIVDEVLDEAKKEADK